MEKPYKQSVLRTDNRTRSDVALRFHEMFVSYREPVRENESGCRYKGRQKLICDKSESASEKTARDVIKLLPMPTQGNPQCALSWRVHSPMHNDYYCGARKHDQEVSRALALGCSRWGDFGRIQIRSQTVSRNTRDSFDRQHSLGWQATHQPARHCSLGTKLEQPR